MALSLRFVPLGRLRAARRRGGRARRRIWSASGSRPARRGGSFERPRQNRQAHAKDAAGADSAFDVDGAAVIADDTEADGQSQTGALADGFGGEKRVEQSRAVFEGDAATVVTHFDAHVLGIDKRAD